MPDQSSQAEIIKESSSEATLTTRFDFSLPPTLLAEHDHLGDGQKALTGPEASPSTTTTGQDEVAIVRQLHLARRSPSAIAPWGPHTVEESRLRVRTDLNPHLATGLLANEHVTIPGTSPRPPNAALSILTRTPSLRSTLSPSVTALDSTSPSSLSSPFLGAMAEITPLPSPLMMGDSPGPWHDESREPRTTISSGPSSDVVKQTPSDDPTWSPTPRSREKRKPYPVLIPAANEIGRAAVASDARNRSVSEYTAEVNRLPRPRIPTLSGPRPPPDELPTAETRLTREEYLAEGRGLAPPTAGLPSPPQSDRSKDESDRNGSAPQVDRPAPRHAWSTSPEWFAATSVGDNKRRRWRALRLLGQGTFSKVILAISDGVDGHHNPVNVEEPPSPVVDGTPLHDGDVNSRELVAVKVVQHGPAGGASEERVESSLKRELDIMRSIHHPSLVQLKAVDVEPSRALLVLRYCPGGDLFDLASQTRSPLSPSLIGRIFSELVTAVLYLHARYIVHRDIKLENVLLNLPVEQMREKEQDWQHYPYSVVTLTDLGLSRRIDPDHPELHTRCGSEDYAAPELLMGQPYDGRQTDAWALGVLLYALMEGRLPFDPPPGASEQQRMSRTVHRIARCDWSWCRYADEDGEPGDFGELEGARSVVEGLLRRVSRRLILDHVADTEWVRQAVQVEGGIRFHEDHLRE